MSIAIERLKRAVADLPKGGMQTGDYKVTLKLADAQRAIAELEGLKAERDALAAKNWDLGHALGLARSGLVSGSLNPDQLSVIKRAFETTPQQCLNEIRAEAARAGFIAGADAIETIQMLGSSESITDLADAYAAKVRQGGE